MKLTELLKSSGRVHGYDRTSNLKKQFGTLYLFNKKVNVKEGSNGGRSVIEVSMHLSGLTDKVFDGKTSRPVHAHRVKVAIAGAEVQKISQKELISLIRSQNLGYEDEEKYPSELILDAVNSGAKMLKGVTIMESDRTAGRPSKDVERDSEGKVTGNLTYALINDKIPNDSEVQVHCSCSSYYWTFQWYNCDNGVDIFNVKPSRYIPKSKRGIEARKRGSSVKNPGKNPGMCKHITLLFALLMKQSVIENTKGMYIHLNDFKKSRYLSRTGYDKLMKDFGADYRIKSEERKSKNFWYRNMR